MLDYDLPSQISLYEKEVYSTITPPVPSLVPEYMSAGMVFMTVFFTLTCVALFVVLGDYLYRRNQARKAHYQFIYNTT